LDGGKANPAVWRFEGDDLLLCGGRIDAQGLLDCGAEQDALPLLLP
jgi:hypothetical protein